MLLFNVSPRKGFASTSLLGRACLVALVSGLGGLAGNILFSKGMELHANLQILQKESYRLEKLRAQSKTTWARIMASDRLMQELIDGKLTLLEAARQYCDLYAEAPLKVWMVIKERHSGATDEERFCRHLISYAARALENQPDQARHVTEKLEAELEEYLRHDDREVLGIPQGEGWDGELEGENNLIRALWLAMEF
jgi:hypothetical protein